jgi:class 3 adenylate cyclase/tetratricopeptide (TPR) repeat protein
VPGVPTPDTYVPKHLAEKILASRHKLEGERKQVTVLFADIRGSTSLLERLDPEEAQKIIDPVLHVMMDAVHKYEGTVNQVLGDGIMALFGAPLSHEDHALRACYAALAMQEEMRRYRQRLGQSEESGLHIGVGMNSGEVVVRSIDTDLNIDYSALGHTTHLAARMQELAGPGIALMSTGTLRQVEGFVQIQSLGPVQAKGISQPVEAYSLIGATTARTRVQAGAIRGLTPLVGRSTEIDIFTKLVQRASAGHGQILAMIGEPGIGKSRLVHEFTRHRLPPDWLVLEGASASYGKATPYLPLIELLRHYFGIGPDEGSDDIQSRVMTQILELDSALKNAVAPLLSLLGALPDKKITDQDRDWLAQMPDVPEMIGRFNSLDPQQRRRYTLDALKRIWIRESRRQNLLLVFEDLHWIDHETQAFLDSLVDSLPMARLLLLVNYRPGYSHDWSEKSYYTQLRVEPLQSSSAEELLLKLLGNNPDLSPLRQLLVKRTEGNPFFAEESVRSLVETGVLTGEKGIYRPGLKIDNLVIPSTVQNVVADRIDRLPAEEKHLLQTAAVIGVVVPFDLLQNVSELSDEPLLHYLGHLKSAEFIYETNLFPQLEYTFKHALTNEVAYGALLHERKVTLHARTARELEAKTPSSDHVEQLAHHAFFGEIWEKAAMYSRQAGTKAMGRSAYREAVVYFDRALSSLGHVSKTRHALEQALENRLDLRNALFPVEELDRLHENLQAAETLAESLGDEHRLGRVCAYWAHYYTLMGDRDKAAKSSERGLSIATKLGDFALQVELNYYVGRAYYYTGDYRRSIECHKRNLDLLSASAPHESFDMECPPAILCRAFLVMCLSETGEFSSAIEHGCEAIRLAEQIRHTFGSIYADFALGLAHLRRGELKSAIEVLERGIDHCRVADIRVQFPLVGSPLGFAYVLVGRVDDGIKLLEETVGQTASKKRVSGQAFRVSLLSEAYLRAGRFADAAANAALALELSQLYQERGREAWILRLLAEISRMRGPAEFEEAESKYGRALNIAEHLGMRPLAAHCHFGLGELYTQCGQIDKSSQELSTATDLYRSMNMTAGLYEAEAALASISDSTSSPTDPT